MTGKVSARGIADKAGRFIGHVAAVVVGFVLMVIGLGLGVTMVMLPVGLVIGLVGVLLFTWGLVGHLQKPESVDS